LGVDKRWEKYFCNATFFNVPAPGTESLVSSQGGIDNLFKDVGYLYSICIWSQC